MKKVSVSLREDHVDRLDDRQAEGDASSRSGALREILDEYEDLRTEVDELHTECEDLRTECERLRTRLESREDRIDELEAQLARRSQVEEKIDTLAKRTEEPAPPFFVRWARWFRSRGDSEQ